ncbi:34554_t:CDS:1, partial [Racocetra persica]
SPLIIMPDASHSDFVPFTFKWPHWGSNVSIAGSFDDPYSPWSPIPMTKSDSSSNFVITLNLKSSTPYYYKFVVDGQWVLDSDEEAHPDSGGHYNHVVCVPPPPVMKSDNDQDVVQGTNGTKEEEQEWQLVHPEETS